MSTSNNSYRKLEHALKARLKQALGSGVLVESVRTLDLSEYHLGAFDAAALVMYGNGAYGTPAPTTQESNPSFTVIVGCTRYDADDTAHFGALEYLAKVRDALNGYETRVEYSAWPIRWYVIGDNFLAELPKGTFWYMMNFRGFDRLVPTS